MSGARQLWSLLLLGVSVGFFIPTLLSVVRSGASPPPSAALPGPVPARHCVCPTQACPLQPERVCPTCPVCPAVTAPAPAPPACPSCAACPACPPAAAAAPAAPTAAQGGATTTTTTTTTTMSRQQCKTLFAKHNIEGDNMKEQLELDGLLYLLRTYCGHGDGTTPGLVDFPSTQPHTTVLDIGSNKGFSLFNFFALWGDLGDTLLKSVAQRRPYAGHAGGTVTIHAFEPLSSVYAILQRVATHFAPLGMHTLHTHHMAVSNFTGEFTLSAPNTEESTELAGLAIGGARRDQRGGTGVSERVQVVTVDGWVKQHAIEHIIHMKVDTEGNDGRVVYGADRTLRDHVITTAVLEYDRAAWGSVYGTPLRQVVKFLAARGYDAYFIAGSNLIRLSGETDGTVDGSGATEWWQSSYDGTRWSNVWVTLRSSACARKTMQAFARKTDAIPAACYA